MNRITFPLKQHMRGPEVADLQGVPRLPINRRLLLADDQTAARELAELRTQERATQTFDRATGKLVSNSQSEQSLQASGETDELAVNALNTPLKKLDSFGPALSREPLWRGRTQSRAEASDNEAVFISVATAGEEQPGTAKVKDEGA